MTHIIDSYRLLIADVYEVAGTSRRSSEALAAKVGQTAARWHVLSVVSEEALSVAAAARRLGLARQSVQRVVNELNSEALVILRNDPNDRRAPLIGLTAKGRRVLSELHHSSEQDRRELLTRSGLSVADLEQARATLHALAENWPTSAS